MTHGQHGAHVDGTDSHIILCHPIPTRIRPSLTNLR